MTRRNGISIFLSIELMLNASQPHPGGLLAPDERSHRPTGRFFVMAVAAAEAAVGLALFIAVVPRARTIDVTAST